MVNFPTLVLVFHDCDNQLIAKYQEQIDKHNNMVQNDDHPNSGFDLFVPNEVCISPINSIFMKLGVKASMIEDNKNIAYQIYPRSRLSKTPLMLANHVGIIDSGYRGELVAAFRNLSNGYYVIEDHIRLVQICHPQLKPFMVRIENQLNDTSRGEGGFGSTGV